MSKRPPAPYDARRTPLVVGRVPLLPVSAIADVYAADDPLDALRTLLAGSSFVRQALRVASPSLAEAIDAWLAGQPLRNPDAPLRALSYVARMAARTTPFGIFAGIGAVELGDETTLRLDESARRTHTRPDMGLLWELVSAIESGDSRRRVAYVTNEAAFERGGRLYVTNVELTSYEQTEESFATAQRPVSLKNTDAVRFVRELARTPRPYEQIAAALGERFEAAAPECEKVLDRLIESGVLISELRASPVGDPVGYIRERVRAIDPDAAAPLEKALAGAAALDAKPLAARSDAQYRNVVERFAALSAKPADHAVQIDTYVPFSGTLGAAIFEDVERLAELCMRQGATLSLAKLRSRFEQRYEGSERLVPLLELVDPNVGLGLPDGLERDEAASAERDALLTAMACEALRCGSEEIELSAEVLETLAPSLGDGVELPDSLEIGFHLAATSREALDRGEYRVIPAAFGASERATRSLGRFAHLFDVPLQRRIEEVARRSVNPERLNAELCFVPSASRIYNVMVRPELLGETIAIGVGGPRTGREMTPDDLWVGLDGGRFYLWSQSRRRRVHPCETHVFNTDRSAPNICRFLASVAGDGRRFPGWFGWGPASTLAYLPRVRSGNLVLATRQWRLRMKELGATAQTAARTLERWRELWNLPRYVYLTESDNRLLLDLDSPIAPALLLDQRNEREETAIVTEALPVPGAEWLEGEQGGYAVEFVAALLPRHVAAHEEPAAEPVTLRERRKFGLGSSWSYIKLYLGEQAFDDFLLRTVLPAVGEFSSTGRIDRWFYV
ncbi:MAG TPA: lantibiotic dehydratase family protein, partial [Verrucomicrobiae bacterium]|nr:lantibiotic dehydratase family protein [Verrucomicrobiae bacterium]